MLRHASSRTTDPRKGHQRVAGRKKRTPSGAEVLLEEGERGTIVTESGDEGESGYALAGAGESESGR